MYFPDSWKVHRFLGKHVCVYICMCLGIKNTFQGFSFETLPNCVGLAGFYLLSFCFSLCGRHYRTVPVRSRWWNHSIKSGKLGQDIPLPSHLTEKSFPILEDIDSFLIKLVTQLNVYFNNQLKEAVVVLAKLWKKKNCSVTRNTESP